MPNKKAKSLYIELLKHLEDYVSPCRENGLLFDTDQSIPAYMRSVSEPEAKRLCEGCALKNLCLDYAVEANEPYGIWGGTTPDERLRIRKPLTNA